MELGGERNLEENILHDVATERARKRDRFFRHIETSLETPSWSGQAEVYPFRREGSQGELNRATGGIAGGQLFREPCSGHGDTFEGHLVDPCLTEP